MSQTTCSLLILFSVIFTITSAISVPTDGKIINDELDKIIFETLRERRSILEPVQIPDHREAVTFKFASVDVTSQISFYDIVMHGLTTIRRTGDAYIQKNKADDMIISANLAMGVINFDMKGLFQVLNVGSERNMTGRIVHIDMDVVVKYSKKTNEFKVKLLEVNELTGFRLKINKAYLFDGIRNRIIQGSISSLKRLVKLSIETIFHRILDDVINHSKIMRTLVEEHYDRSV